MGRSYYRRVDKVFGPSPLLPAGRAWRHCERGRQYVVLSVSPSRGPRSGAYRLRHADEGVLQKVAKQAIAGAGITKRLLPHVLIQLRHAPARCGHDLRTIQELLGHKDVSTTMIYTHVLNRSGKGVKSPLD